MFYLVLTARKNKRRLFNIDLTVKEKKKSRLEND